MRNKDLQESVSPRVLIVRKSEYANKRNIYKSKNYTQTCDLYLTENGQEVGEWVIGYAEVASGTVIDAKDNLADFKKEVENIASEVIWKDEVFEKMRIEDHVYSVYIANSSLSFDEIMSRVGARVAEDDSLDVENGKIRETAKQVFLDTEGVNTDE